MFLFLAGPFNAFSQDGLPPADIGASSAFPTSKAPKEQKRTIVPLQDLMQDSVLVFQRYYKPLSLTLVALTRRDSLVKDSLERTFRAKYQSDSYDYAILPKEKGREMEPEASPAKLRNTRSDWITYLLIGIIIFFVAIKYNYFKDFKNISDAFWTVRGINLLIREDNLLNARSSLLFFSLFSFTYGLVIYNIYNFYEVSFLYAELPLYLIISLIVAIVFIIRVILLLLMEFVFSSGKIFKSYIAIILTSNYVFTIYLIPLLIIYTLLPPNLADKWFILLPLVLIVNQIIQYLRGTSYIVSHFRFPKFYLIMYLCAFEIAPLLLLIKSFAD